MRAEDRLVILLLQIIDELASKFHRWDDIRPFLQPEARDEHGAFQS